MSDQASIIAASELILNEDGSIYHLHLQPEQLANTVILVGDPDRVEAVSKHFDVIEHKVQKREFVTHTGRVGALPISVVSTGIGTDNIDIVLQELDALKNINFDTRKLNTEHQKIRFIRIGTAGTLHAEVPVDSTVVSQFGIGFDALGSYYEAPYFEERSKLHTALVLHLAKAIEFQGNSYVSAGALEIMGQWTFEHFRGMTGTCPGFYGPQGRVLRLPLRYQNWLPALADFEYNGLRMLNFEMETAGIYLMANLLGHEACSISAILANRALGGFSSQPQQTVDRLIENVLRDLV